jgi:saccharopine dehydrogenase-like NADP-dependent oxidoreductase
MKHIVVLGADSSSSLLIDYLAKQAAAFDWHLTIANTTPSPAPAVSFIETREWHADNETERRQLIARADLVISLLSPALHQLAAADCLQYKKHLLTPLYIDESLTPFHKAVKQEKLLFLHEMGLNPGLDHMSAMQHIHRIKANGGAITSFRSYCGTLVSPESDDNPWHFKITGARHNIVQADKDGAVFKENGSVLKWPYEQLFDPNRVITIPGIGYLAWYPNRDSLRYMSLYGLPNASTFMRTTLRYPEFCFGWKNLVELKLTDASRRYQTDGLSLQEFFQEHFASHGFGEWIEKQLTARFAQTRQLLEKLQQLLDAEQEANEDERKALQDFMMVDNNGQLMDVNLDSIKTQAAATVAGQMHEANLSMKQLFFLGMDDDQTLINKGECSAADVLQFALEQKLLLQPADKDLVVLQHEIGYELDGHQHIASSSLVVKGEDHIHTATNKTMALPLGIAAKHIMSGNIKETGLHIPVMSSVYIPVLKELAKNGIRFTETDTCEDNGAGH